MGLILAMSVSGAWSLSWERRSERSFSRPSPIIPAIFAEWRLAIFGGLFLFTSTFAPVGMPAQGIPVRREIHGSLAEQGTEMTLTVDQVTKNFGGFRPSRVSRFPFPGGSSVGLIGPNDRGKTTLINCITGALPARCGAIRLGEETISISRRTASAAGNRTDLPDLQGVQPSDVLDNLRIPASPRAAQAPRGERPLPGDPQADQARAPRKDNGEPLRRAEEAP